MRLRPFASFAVLVPLGCLAACGSDDTVAGGADSGPDATVDAAADTSAPPADAAPDATADAPVDAAIDAAPADAGPDSADAADATPSGVGCDPATYPPGPYGTAVGATLANLAFSGLTDTNASGGVADDAPVTLCLGRYRQAPAAKVLVVLWTAAWCAPCQAEEPGLVTLAKQYAGKAVFFEAQAQNVGGLPASIASAVGWASKYKVGFDLGIDPSLTLSPFFPVPDAGVAWPSHLIARTDTMTVAVAESGAHPAADIQAEIDALIATIDAGAD